MKNDRIGLGERAPWGKFPKIIRNGDLQTLDREPEYQAAKGGDREAALALVDKLLTDEIVVQIKNQIGDEKTLIVPVLAVENTGKNKIPLALATVLADRLGIDPEFSIVQRERVGRTGTGADHRLAFNPTFTGNVVPGQKYLIVDDTLTMGGTLASLRGYIENRGGHVLAGAVMNAHPGALDLAVKPNMLAAISAKHGPEMNNFWKEYFGYGIEQLTQGEAGHLKAAPSVDAIRNRIVAARNEGRRRLDDERTQASEGRKRQRQEIGKGAAERLQHEARELNQGQQDLLESSPVEQAYQETLAIYVQGKEEQVGRIEDRLEDLVEMQEARLQQIQVKQPGFLARPGARKAWQNNVSAQKARLVTLQKRLDAVRGIREEMGLHSPRIEEMATRKLRAENPQLAADWSAMRESARRQQLLEKRQEQERKKTLERQRPGREQSLSLPKPH